MAPKIGVLALQGAVAEHERALRSSGAEVRKVRRPAELDDLDGLVVPGGESTAMARLAAPVQLMPAIRRRLDEGMAVFGTCAGLILAADTVSDAEALVGFDRIGGLGVVVRRNAYGSQLHSFEDDLEVTGLDSPLPAVFIRAPVIEDVTSPRVEVLAEAGGRPVAVRQGRILAASFHPELTPDFRLHKLFTELSAQ
ncbi:pyridoxal 5'-phosphate synthase glutaminase subunit PdxT [Nesterenkonia sphaerica]|uniref:Pyridoxal 5'-phosphate synthase subunit PdxT n=1 Tax=Nesterenkonia sphaerica TaxID=1804988 RepID=A0A5R9A432_9MICC|nr:pyridoxal 5'-phosphate synthase glutaminase subunit PdxT [Nesterenkonia sphaerica]TLP73300.1 pyridoxal 5'-phosphate synthase glutaminase subunit PdxT [Nesterenkonia sphaerica]